MTETPKDSVAITAQKDMIARMQAQVAPEWSAARGPVHDGSVNGRAAGGPVTPSPPLREGAYAMKPDPHNGTPPPQPLEK